MAPRWGASGVEAIGFYRYTTPLGWKKTQMSARSCLSEKHLVEVS